VLIILAARADTARAEPKRTEGWIETGPARKVAYFVCDSGREGPTVMVVGGMHGSEPAGAAAAGQIRYWPVTRGKLIVIPRANPQALTAGLRLTPGVEENVADLNRNFPSTRPSEPRGEQAGAIWRFVVDQKPDWLIDLHESLRTAQADSDMVGSSIIAYPSDETLGAARAMLEAVNAAVADPERRFIQRRAPVGGSLARAAAVQLGAHAMILETTRAKQAVSERTRQHRILVHRCLRHLAMIDDSLVSDRITPFDRPAGHLFVGLYDGAGAAGKGIPRVLEILGAAPVVHVERVGPSDIGAGALEQFDVVMFTGGSGSGQGKAIEERGRQAVRQFVEKGGGYIGICAGSYLACTGFTWGLGILDAKTKSSRWQRGAGTVKVEATQECRNILGSVEDVLDIRYASGPVIEPAGIGEIPDYVTLASFRTELARNGTPEGIMVGSPAVAAGRYGRGRVICFSPHPEQTQGLDGWVLRAVRWAAGQVDPGGSRPPRSSSR